MGNVKVTPTAADREALCQDVLLSIPEYMHGSIFNAFARHRIAATASGYNEAKEAAATREDGSLTWRPEVAAFANLMECQLRANDHKPGWKGEAIGSLRNQLFREARELSDALNLRIMDPSNAAAAVGREAADVANFAMMIADVAGALTPSKDTDHVG